MSVVLQFFKDIITPCTGKSSTRFIAFVVSIVTCFSSPILIWYSIKHDGGSAVPGIAIYAVSVIGAALGLNVRNKNNELAKLENKSKK